MVHPLGTIFSGGLIRVWTTGFQPGSTLQVFLKTANSYSNEGSQGDTSATVQWQMYLFWSLVLVNYDLVKLIDKWLKIPYFALYVVANLTNSIKRNKPKPGLVTSRRQQICKQLQEGSRNLHQHPVRKWPASSNTSGPMCLKKEPQSELEVCFSSCPAPMQPCWPEKM